MRARELPRVVVAGLGGDVGKSLVTLGLARALTSRGRRVAPFKKGPDFIDGAWLGAAARAPGRNLDTYLMSPAAVRGSLYRAAAWADIAVVEGNRGLFDGVDAEGSHSTAALAELLGAPVVLVLSAAKVTRSIVVQVLGCRALDAEVPLAGVVLNRVATGRQESLMREALAAVTDLPVLGAIPRLDEQPLPSRHLGLVCSDEHPDREAALEMMAEVAGKYLDLDAVCALAAKAPALLGEDEEEAAPPLRGSRVRIGVLRDAAFSFYYPENLEALEAAGAELTTISPLTARSLPPIDALYAGGGFPEEHAAALSSNRSLRASLRTAIRAGLPVWAECGGLMYLSEGLIRDGQVYPMVGALPVACEVHARPQGHGYVSARIDRPNPFLPEGTHLRGHEFHYSRLVNTPPCDTILALERGVGVGFGRDGLRVDGVVATYTHLHALATREWAPALVARARGQLDAAGPLGVAGRTPA